MKKQLLFLITLILLFTSCKNDSINTKNEMATTEEKTDLNLADQADKLNSELKKYEVPSQHFSVSSKKQSQVKSKLGTIIYINPDALETIDGTNFGENIEIELKELTNQKDLLRSNAQTLSNGKLLVSGGAYYIDMQSDGKKLKIKNGKSLKVDFVKLSDKEMLLFYGKKDSLGIMNWESTNTKFSIFKGDRELSYRRSENKTESLSTDEYDEGDIEDILAYTENSSSKDEPSRPLTKEEKKRNRAVMQNAILNNRMYNSMKLTQLGWINCDRFSEIENKTNIDYEFVEEKDLIFCNLYLVFKDINSVMHAIYFNGNKKVSEEFNDVPVGANVTLIAVSMKNEKKYSFKTAFKVKANEKIKIQLEAISDKEFEQLFQ